MSSIISNEVVQDVPDKSVYHNKNNPDANLCTTLGTNTILDIQENTETSSILDVQGQNPTSSSIEGTSGTTADIKDTLDYINNENDDSRSTTSSGCSKRTADVADTKTDNQSMLVEREMPGSSKRKKVELYVEDSGPQWYNVTGNLVTQSIITKNLPKVFEFLPVFGKPKSKGELDDYYKSKIREFVGCELDDEKFHNLEKYCSPDNLKSGNEIVMNTKLPAIGLITDSMIEMPGGGVPKPIPNNLCILKKGKLREDKEVKMTYVRKLKYRGVVLITQEGSDDEESECSSTCHDPSEELEPGRDLLYRVRVYRPYAHQSVTIKERYARTRHSVFLCDVVVAGRQRLSALRDRFVCHNDVDMRLDVADNPDAQPHANAKAIFPSGFLFINNVFYVDTREGCIDYSAPIREWALKKGIGDFQKRDMAAVRLDELVLKLGHPDVYVHQGNCEHIFIFSEVRLVSPTDPLRLSMYPHSTAVALNQTVYCTTCAEYAAKWIVVGCVRVPFDPSFFCETCFKLYLYKDGKKIGDFKAYSYRGNVLNVLKPQ